MSAFRVLVLDNRDSFVHTLVDYVVELGADVERVDALGIAADEVAAGVGAVDAVLVSPGPGTPEHAGVSIPAVRAAAEADIPLLGVCLGHQAIAVAYGARVGHAPELVHGSTSLVAHDAGPLFAGLPDPFAATRYHSLAVDRSTLPDELRVTAETASGVVMAIEHRTAPLTGVQFHPESILTEGGYRLLGNWLESAGLGGAAARGAHRSPRRNATAPCTPRG